MIEQFLKFIHKEKLFHSSQRILLAISGGADSMVMLNLFRNAGFSFAVAHCNFHLRGEESDGDEQFVSDFCDLHHIQFLVKHFDTKEFAEQEGISIEMAARDLRYHWFNEMLDQHKFDLLATAHHQDDVIETFLINLSRGSGIKGLSGIQAKSGRIIRPLLFSNREEILDYCQRFSIQFRTDSSNQDTIYKRNLIREKVLPLLEQVNPAFRRNAIKTIGYLDETEMLFRQRMSEIKSFVYSEDEQGAMIHIDRLLSLNPIRTILFELIRDFGFRAEQVEDIADSIQKESGRKFYSEKYRLVKDREYLLISPFMENRNEVIYIEENCEGMNFPVQLSIEKFDRKPDFKFSSNPNVADLDLDMLDFPLMLRHWQEGEYFKPLGMTGLKKLSDFFIDEKYSIPEKENAWILASGNHIVWILGKRIDDQYKITGKTKRILRIRLLAQ